MTWDFADVVGRRLVAWGTVSSLVGLISIAAGSAFWQGLGVMLVVWGAADALIGVVGRVLAERNRLRTIGDHPARMRAARRVRLILLVNVALDVVYLGLGLWLVARFGVGVGAGVGDDAWWLGAGWGIVLQGGFLLVFDIAHAHWVPAGSPLLPLDLPLFAGPGHEPFRLSRLDDSATGGSGPRGALLVHGFAGSPRELRPLAAVLAADGWLVEVPRLPGHGPEIRDIADYRVTDWIASVEEAAAALRAAGAGTLLVVGHSVGGSLALATAGSTKADALVLLAPFWWPTPWWQRIAGPVLRLFLPPGFRLFSRLDLADPATREGVESFLPGIDLDDPEVVAGLRDMRVPLSTLDQLFRVSARAGAAASSVRVPVLAIQGTADTVSRPERSRKLLARLPVPAEYVEVTAAHDLASETAPARDEVLRLVLRFSRTVGSAASATSSGSPAASGSPSV